MNTKALRNEGAANVAMHAALVPTAWARPAVRRTVKPAQRSFFSRLLGL